jgi:hypothetical protein
MKFRVRFKNRRESWWEEFDIPRVKTLTDARKSGRSMADFYNAIIDREGMPPKMFVKAELIDEQ